MNTHYFLLIFLVAGTALASTPPGSPDWLVNPEPFKSHIDVDAAKHELTLENGLTSRTLRLVPDAATIDYRNLTTDEQMLRAVGPEAIVTLDGTEYAIGGLKGQTVQNYLKADEIDALQADPAAYHFVDWKEESMVARFAWQKRPQWLSRDLPWPAPGKNVTLKFAPPKPGLPEIDVHYTIYDGIPLIEKWVTIHNTADHAVRVNTLVSEELKTPETESSDGEIINLEPSNLYVESDYAFDGMNGKSANRRTVKWLTDPTYKTQVGYTNGEICRLEVQPEFGPDTDVAPGDTMTSVRAFELFRDATDRERCGLEQRQMYRVIAPWSQENPVMAYLVSNNPATIRKIIDQAADVGVELVNLSFGSGMNMENRDPAYEARYKEVADYAKSKGVVLGAYSLLASRGAANPADNCKGPGNRVRYGVMPCLTTQWGRDYLAQIQSFLTNTDFADFENDGSYPGDTDAATHHGHHGLLDSQWVQFRAICGLYQWCRANGVYLTVPDWYFLNGSSKCAMGYKETDWSLPRDQQELIERQNVYDGTWEKTSSMGWMFVPLTQYHGGGAAATIEPLHEHLDHYEARLSDLFGAGVQACYRGPRIYDTDTTEALVKKWISFYKEHRQVLDADMIHLRRPDGRDWDGFLHVNPQGQEKGLAFFYNPLDEDISREIRVPLHYTGLTDTAIVSINGENPATMQLDRSESVTLTISIPAHKRTWILFTAP